jgi:hypothetical protein
MSTRKKYRSDTVRPLSTRIIEHKRNREIAEIIKQKQQNTLGMRTTKYNGTRQKYNTKGKIEPPGNSKGKSPSG